METVIQGSTLQTLRAGLRGTAHASGEEGWRTGGSCARPTVEWSAT
jgi:hypothetical protein